MQAAPNVCIKIKSMHNEDSLHKHSTTQQGAIKNHHFLPQNVLMHAVVTLFAWHNLNTKKHSGHALSSESCWVVLQKATLLGTGYNSLSLDKQFTLP